MKYHPSGRFPLTHAIPPKPLRISHNGQTTTFVYDGDGGRVKKIAGTTTTRYIGKLYECDNTSCTRFIFAGNTRIATVAVNTGAIHYWHQDHLGSSSVITDNTGTLVQTLAYYPYGATRTNQSSANPAVDVPYKYTGKELDSTTGLYYYEARYYDPTLGRFISADTIVPNPRDPQDLNRYTYAGNNPFKYTDPTGHFKLKRFFRRTLGEIGTTALGLAIQGLGASIFGPAHFLIGGAVLTQSQSGRAIVTAQAGVAGGVLCGPICGGVASGATSAALARASGQGGNIVRSTIAGAIGGLAGGVANLAVPGNVLLAGLIGGAAGGAANAAVGGGSVLQGALIGGASGALAAYLHTQGVVDRTTGPVWNGPNTLIGGGFLLLNGVASVPSVLAGGQGLGFGIGTQGIQITNAPLMREGTGFTLGDIAFFASGVNPKTDFVPRYDGRGLVNIGLHEAGHVAEGRVLGPLLGPVWLGYGGPTATNPLEIGADNYAEGRSVWSGF